MEKDDVFKGGGGLERTPPPQTPNPRRQDPHWNVEGVAGRTSAPYLHVGCGIINPERVFINHCVISPQTWWKWDIIKKAESDLEALRLSSSRCNYVSSVSSELPPGIPQLQMCRNQYGRELHGI